VPRTLTLTSYRWSRTPQRLPRARQPRRPRCWSG